MTYVYLFPGQGSQTKGMGLGLFEKYPHLVRQADDVVGYSLQRLCLEDPDDLLNRTEFTQVALFVVNSLYYLDRMREGGIQPDFLAGHSLGEFNALFAAGAFDFLTGVEVVAERAKLMSRASNGQMAAILGLKPSQITTILKKADLDRLDIANLNTPHQTVISGPDEDIDRAIPIFQQQGAEAAIRLKISGAFHSRYMREAQTKFAVFLSQYQFSQLKIRRN